jgi:hypothetical protein
MTYTIERIRKKNGEVHERELRRKGQRVGVGMLTLGAPLILVYVDDENKVLTTSPVEAYSETGDVLIVQTRNTVYCLRKVSEVAAHSS